MKAQLINSFGCVIGVFEDVDDKACLEKIKEDWFPLLQQGDTIKFVEVTEEESDPLDDFNYVGSRHHY